MTNVLVNDESLSDIADAIRGKLNVQTTYKPGDMAAAINTIPSGGITPTGTKSITANGTGIDVAAYAYADVSVPNTYAAGDEGKVVSSGALVSQTSETYTSNNTYDTTTVSSVTVNVSGGSTPVINSLSVTENGTYTAPTGVDGYSPITVDVSSGGGYTAADFADASKPEGAVVFDQVTLSPDGVWFAGRTGITKIFGTNYNDTGNRTGTFRAMTGLQYAIFPKLTRAYNSFLYGCSNLEAVDWYGGGTGGSLIFTNCTKLKTMVIRRTDNISALASNNAFNGTLFDSGKAGGTLYVPSALISEYQAATNWSTILGYPNNQIKSIESTATDPTAPIDLTRYYVDGTPIPTT